MSELQIKCQGLSLGYEKRTVSRDISFEVRRGDYLCVVGENGSGKSTLMKALLGLIKPLEGKISFEGGIRPSDIGYLPQQSELQQDFPASVEEVVLSGCIAHTGILPLWTRAHRLRAHNNLRRLSIDGLQKRPFRELSGGQRQRVLLARALCAADKLLLLDEPVSGLSPAAAYEMYKIIERLNREDGISIIMISHDVGEAIKYATHILHLGEAPLFFGKKEDYLESALFLAREEKRDD